MTSSRLAGWMMACLAAIGASCTAPAPGDGWRNPKDGMDFVWIPPSTLRLEPASEGGTADSVAFVRGFWMGRTEVTVGQFRQFVDETGYVTEAEQTGHRFDWRNPDFPQTDDHPVVYIGMEDARHYADWAGVELPTEAEWVYAARGGAPGRFHWGDDVDDAFVWHRENAGDGTRPVASKLPNSWGLYDTIGNAAEWVAVCEGVNIHRGGSWTRCPRYLHLLGNLVEPLNNVAAARLSDCSPPLQYPWDDDRGFRCVRRPDDDRGR
jgi:formylglycine-generating enzyme required for sulfatase activity